MNILSTALATGGIATPTAATAAGLDAGNWIAIGALAVSLISLLISWLNRQADKKRGERLAIKARVWEVLNGNGPGLRTVSALSQDDGDTTKRIELLERTAQQLTAAGAKSLGDELELVLKENWPNSDQGKAARDRFTNLLTKFMEPE